MRTPQERTAHLRLIQSVNNNRVVCPSTSEVISPQLASEGVIRAGVDDDVGTECAKREAQCISVTARGKIQQLNPVASEPPGLMDYKVHRAMRNARFRPRIEEGVTVKTPNLVYRHRFEYYPLPKPADSSDEESAQEGGITAPEAG